MGDNGTCKFHVLISAFRQISNQKSWIGLTREELPSKYFIQWLSRACGLFKILEFSILFLLFTNRILIAVRSEGGLASDWRKMQGQ
jgi:hypothetical protein